jgi:GTP-binding protein EngB required for normal cell division
MDAPGYGFTDYKGLFKKRVSKTLRDYLKLSGRYPFKTSG